jgi:sugar phosphate isomerase/epimerase
MKSYNKRFPFKIGTTSFILPVKEDSIVSNVRFLKNSFDMVQLLFFGREYLDEVMSRQIIQDLGALREGGGLAYTIHMPSDLELLDPSEAALRRSLDVIDRIMTETASLNVEGYVLHVDRLERGVPRVELDSEHSELFQRALEAMTVRLGEAAENICIENTTYDMTYFSGILMRNRFNVCMDAGHISLHNHDFCRFIEVYGPRVRQVHLHGVAGGRDHQALTGLDAVAERCISQLLSGFTGSVIIEVYNLHDLITSAEFISGAFGHDFF